MLRSLALAAALPVRHQAQNARLTCAACGRSSGSCGAEFVTEGRASVTVWLSFSMVADRESSDRRLQPETASPTCRRTRFLVGWSITTATWSISPIAVPMSVRCGGSGGGGGGGGASATGIGAGGGAGGRRDAEKTGRSRVALRTVIGIPQSGFPPGGGSWPPGI